MEEKTGKSKQKSRGVGQVIERGAGKYLVRIFIGSRHGRVSEDSGLSVVR